MTVLPLNYILEISKKRLVRTTGWASIFVPKFERWLFFLYSIFMVCANLPDIQVLKFQMIQGLGGIIFIPTALTACAPGSDQPTPTPTADEILISFLETWNDAVETGDVEHTLAYFAQDATLETVGYYHLISKGWEEIHSALEYWIGRGVVHPLGEYALSSDDQALYWDLSEGDPNHFCHGKVILRDLKIIYLGYSTCKS